MLALLNRAAFNFRLWTLLLPLFSFLLVGTGCLAWDNWTGVDVTPYFGLLIFATVAWSIAVENYDLCSTKYILMRGGRIYSALLATLFTVFAELMFMFFYRSASFSRAFICATSIVLLVTAIGLRLLLRLATVNRLLPSMQNIRVLVVGADDFAQRTAESLVDRRVGGVEIAGFVAIPGQEAKVDKVLCDLEGLGDKILGSRLDDIVIALPVERFHELPQVLAKLDSFGVPVRLVLELGEQGLASERLLQINGVWMANLCHTPAESIMYMVSKRAFDIAFSLFALFVASPIMILSAAAIKMTSPGPLFFVQDRVGLNGDVFKMYKFRTMRVSAKSESDTIWTKDEDPRRTLVGTILRKTSLDELPQFFNVLKGDMSVVGPRPERPYFVQKFAAEVPRYNARHYIKVGITGWAQVNGWRGDTCIKKRVEHDLYYIQNWSLLFDLRIVLLTVLRTVAAKHAY